MDKFITLIIDYDSSYSRILLLFKQLIKASIPFWYLHKQGKIRLRIQPEYRIHVENHLFSLDLDYIEINYEPEDKLFGGNLAIPFVHSIFCDIALVSTYINSNDRINGKLQLDNDIARLHFINKIVEMFRFDSFEEWDVWNKVCQHRVIDVKKYRTALLSKTYEVFQAISFSDYEISLYSEKNVAEALLRLQANIKNLKDLSQSSILERGIRGVGSSIVIFSFNIMAVSSSKQAGFSHIIKYLKHPDLRRELEM